MSQSSEKLTSDLLDIPTGVQRSITSVRDRPASSSSSYSRDAKYAILRQTSAASNASDVSHSEVEPGGVNTSGNNTPDVEYRMAKPFAHDRGAASQPDISNSRKEEQHAVQMDNPPHQAMDVEIMAQTKASPTPPLKRKRGSVEPEGDANQLNITQAGEGTTFERWSNDDPSTGTACVDLTEIGDIRSSALSLASHTPSLDQSIDGSAEGSPEPTLVNSSAPRKQSFVKSSQSDENEELMNDVESEEERAYLSDSSSLESLGALFGTGSKSCEANESEQEPRQSADRLLSIFQSRSKPDKPFVMSQQRDYKHSLSKLIKQEQRDTSALEMVTEAFALGNEKHEQRNRPAVDVDENELAATVKEEDREDIMRKMMRVMHTAQSLRSDPVWHFFGKSNSITSSKKDHPRFPATAVKNSECLGLLKDRSFREQAFLTGLASELLMHADPSSEVVDWLLEAAIAENREDLAEAYMQSIATALPVLKDRFDVSLLNRILDNQGASEEATDHGKDIQPSQRHHTAQTPELPQTMSQLLRVFSLFAEVFGPEALEYLTALLLRLGIDKAISQDGAYKLEIQNLLETIGVRLDSLVPSDRLKAIVERLTRCVHHRTLQRSLVAIMPCRSIHFRVLKRRLALAFFFDDPLLFHVSLDDASTLTDMITQRLRDNEQFKIRDEGVSFSDLATLISFLDIGIAGGFRPSIQEEAATSTPESKQAVKAFNIQIDQISDQVKRLFTQITDGGASNMERTEAKTVLERLLYRLECSVRTRPRPKTKFILESLEDSRGLGVDTAKAQFMERFLKMPQSTSVS
ncbi:MAG: hypothetical protein M1828_002625 [Chrysothrix sp. TS-e1954]|nr:MAG: hypothetical protein M1828_002625 [Chrysothrix sp. TS-e1954]